MFVIFPADELILMTYGAAIPRISPRPTLDCLREPQVPIVIPARSLPPSLSQSVKSQAEPAVTVTQYERLFSTDPLTSADNNICFGGVLERAQPTDLSLSLGAGLTESNRFPHPYDSRSLLPTISERSSICEVPATPTPQSATPPKPGSRSSLKRSTPVLRTNLLAPRKVEESPLFQNSAGGLNASMYNDLNMRSSAQQEQLPALGHPSRTMDPEYPTGSLQRERSPSIYLEAPPADPTQPRLGPGWGRPMSPMELPPEPSTSQKSPTSKSRLRPKLHIPLGRLGRSTSSDQRESYRLREDLELQVENPVFNTENLRQRNFDAFFDSGEPVYKLQPKTPHTVPTDGASVSKVPLALDNYAGIYDSSPRKGRGTASGGLFARSQNKNQLAASRSTSVDQCDPAVDDRAAALEPGSVSAGSAVGVPQKDFLGKSSSGPKSRSFFEWRGSRCGSPKPKRSMASNTGVLKDYGHSSLNEAFKSQNNVNFKLIKTVADFTETLSHLYEEHATALQTLVTTFRRRNAELRKERPACHLAIFHAWETFLQEVETDSQASNDVANVLYRQVSRPMLDKSFHRKVQSRKIFTHRESFETIIAKTEEKLSKCRLDYKQCYVSQRQNPTPHTLTEYIDAHNAYVQQLHATNAMLETYQCETMPQLMQELEEVHGDLCSIISESIQQGADVIASKASDQAKRYSSLTTQCTSVIPAQDLSNFVRSLPPLPVSVQKVTKRPYAPPQPGPGEPEDSGEYNDMNPALRNELVFDRNSSASLRVALESLKREAMDLEIQIRQLQDSIDALTRQQIRGIEGQLYNKVNETQEDLSMHKFDLRAKQLHLAAIRAQKELFVSKIDPGSPRGERKLSAATAPSMKTKWLKAIKSLKPASGSAAQQDRRNGAGGSSSQALRPNEDGSHHLQEYTYKKITACDVCSQILRGHTRQGLRCRICKLNAHGDCAAQLPRCQPKQKLLRRQKSTSELENRVDVDEENADNVSQTQSNANTEAAVPPSVTLAPGKFRQKTPFIERIAQLGLTDIDQVYRVLKQAGEFKNATTIAADKSVQNAAKDASSQPDIPIVNVPECPERTDRPAATGGTGIAVSSAGGRGCRSGVRPPPVHVPILGVQLQQQELSQQWSGGGGGGLPVPSQDISSSSDYRLTNISEMPSVASMTTAAYLSGGISINYYATSATMLYPAGTATSTASSGVNQHYPYYSVTSLQQQQQQPALQMLPAETCLRRRLFAGFRPMSGFGRSRSRSSQHRSISLPETPHSPRRQKLNLRMKSLSLDSPESSELHGQIRRRQQPVPGPSTGAAGSYYHGGSGGHLEHNTPPSNNSRLHSPHSPRRQKLNLRMKSLSLDSPESSELHGQIRRRQQPVPGPSTGAAGSYYHGGSGGHLEHNTPPSNNSRLHSPSSPSHQGRKLLYASRGMRGGSVDLPDDMEKSQSSASTSPCPSPVRHIQKSHRLLPTNLYVILYNFKARHADELDLKAGYKVTVIDNSDPDWWKGKVLGRVGYFPSKYCVRLNANEKPFQVTHNLQVSDGERGENITLLRDQIVIQTSDDVNGMVMVRSADNRQGYCPVKYLQEV